MRPYNGSRIFDIAIEGSIVEVKKEPSGGFTGCMSMYDDLEFEGDLDQDVDARGTNRGRF